MNRRLLLAVALLVLAGVITAVALLSGDGGSKPGPRAFASGATPLQHAHVACQEVAEVMAEVKDNGTQQRVFAFVDAARKELAAAATGDPIWLSLQSGVESINRGLRRDDEGASELGIAIARDQCRRAGIFLPGSVR